MSPVSRRRKVKRNRKSGRDAPRLFEMDPPEDCDCPSCSAAAADPEKLIDHLISAFVEVDPSMDPLELEMVAAALLAIGLPGGEAVQDAVLRGFISNFEDRAEPGASAMLAAIAAVAPGDIAAAASAAVTRLSEAGVARPGCEADLQAPLEVENCLRLSDTDGTVSFLSCSFQRAGRAHALLIQVDELDCGAASNIVVLDGDELPGALEALRTDAVEQEVDIVSESLDPEELRWRVERALDARAVHDAELSDEEIADLVTEDGGPGYGALAVLVRARMATLPTPRKARALHADGADSSFDVVVREALAQLARGRRKGSGGRSAAARKSRPARSAQPALPAERKRSAPPAPVYQIKVGLCGATPPIWRRVEVPADISLARLHRVIQIAFAWDDSHLHAFETPFGSFGSSQEDGLPETSVTLEQVAPGPGSRLRYTYDFGDSWDHDVVVEKVVDRSAATTYPRCTGGRRAAPPEDCGGVWGYQDLLQVLDDPSDEEHLDRVEWLGLETASQFDPAEFDAAAVTRALSSVR